MKALITALLCLSVGTLAAQDAFFKDADAFLRAHVRDGRVDYSTISQDSRSLDLLVDQAKTVNVGRASQETQIAYYINLYNLLVIKQLADSYPVRSPKDIGGFFDSKRFEVGGMRVSLNTLEHVVLAGVRNDSRYHFALVCGAQGCPKLASQAVRPDNLEAFLDTRTKAAMNDTAFIRPGNPVGLSEIFSWYAKDFDANPLDYVNRYRDTPLDASGKTTFYTYDWTINGREDANPPLPGAPGDPVNQLSNVQAYTPSVLLKKGQTDVTIFNSIYTQTQVNWMGQDFFGTRETFAGSWVQITRGVSKNARINVGMDINIKASGRTQDTTFAGVGEAFALANDGDHRFGVTTIGPKVKIAPFEGVPNFSIESIFWIPLNANLEGTGGDNPLYFLDWNRPIWWNRFYYDKSFGDFQAFTEIDLLFRIPIYEGQKQALDIPMNLIFSYFPTPKTTVYVLGQHVNRYRLDLAPVPPSEDTDAITSSANYSAYGAGGKYQLTDKLQVEALYTNFWRGINSGLGETYNLGLKYIF